jgi:hypothetical protein
VVLLKPLTTKIKWRNGTYFTLKIWNMVRISIPEGCSTQLVNNIIQSDLSLRVAPEVFHFEWKFKPSILPDSAQLIQGSRHKGHELAMVKEKLKTTIDIKYHTKYLAI